MFEFLMDIDNYESRVIGRWANDSGSQLVSTARVSDGRKPYETGFKHPEYNDGKIVIVECYDSKEEAETGHARWEKIMIDGPLPSELQDCANSELQRICKIFGDEGTYKRQGADK